MKRFPISFYREKQFHSKRKPKWNASPVRLWYKKGIGEWRTIGFGFSSGCMSRYAHMSKFRNYNLQTTRPFLYSFSLFRFRYLIDMTRKERYNHIKSLRKQFVFSGDGNYFC